MTSQEEQGTAEPAPEATESAGLAWEMADWEIHELRGLMTATYGQLKLLGRRQSENQDVMDILFTLEKARMHFHQGRDLAMSSPEFRRRMSHMADPIIDEPLLDDEQLDAP